MKTLEREQEGERLDTRKKYFVWDALAISGGGWKPGNGGGGGGTCLFLESVISSKVLVM